MLQIKTIVVTPFQQNARILIDDVLNRCVIVDPGGDIPLILAELPDDCVIDALWITHSHIDHVSGVALLLTELSKRPESSPRVISHVDDAFNRAHLSVQSQMMGFPYSGDFSITDVVGQGDGVECGGHVFRVLYTPGHAVGHVSFFMEDVDNQFHVPVLIAGDALFQGSIGRTDLPGGNHQQLLDSINNQLLPLPNDTVVLSGHGPNTTIQIEAVSNPFLN